MSLSPSVLLHAKRLNIGLLRDRHAAREDGLYQVSEVMTHVPRAAGRGT